MARKAFCGAAGLAVLAGCAMNISEARPARTLGGGEFQVSAVNNIILPVQVVERAINVVDEVTDDTELTEAEQRTIINGVVASALSSPGFAPHMDIAVGLGYGLDTQLRIGSGIYGASLRRGFRLAGWDTSIGARAAYNSGSSVVPYLDDLNKFAKVADMKRFDGQAFALVGTEFGEWAKLWLGAKWLGSWFKASLDPGLLDEAAEEDLFSGNIMYYGGLLGGAIGYRWIHLVVEVGLYGTWSPGFTVLNYRVKPSGLLVAPSWGLQGTF